MLRSMLARLDARRQRRRVAAITPERARERAARGAALLDDRDPGWAARIDRGSLELSDRGGCVLGQLHGDYRLGLTRSRVVDPSSGPGRFVSPVDLGFQSVSGVGDEAERLDYAFLTRAWRLEIEARRDRPVANPAASLLRVG